MRKLLIVLAAFAFVVASTVPAMADDEWDFYGSARILTFSTTVSKEASATGLEDDDFTNDISGSARTIGANVKAGDIRGRFEAGGAINLRLAYAYWEAGFGKLLVGQDYTPICFFPSGMVYDDNSMVSYGAPYAGRQPQVKLLLLNDALQIALVKPNRGAALNTVTSAAAGYEIDQTTGAVVPTPAVVGVDAVDTDTSIPKIEVAYSLKLGPVSLVLFGGMNTYDEQTVSGTTEKTYSIDSTIFGVGFKVPLGALYINGDVWAATNPGNYGMATGSAVSTAALDAAGTGIEDCDANVYVLVVGYKISDMLTIEGGYGFVDGERTVGAITTSNEKTFTYVQLPITLAKNVVLTPEFGVVDYGDLEVTGAAAVEKGDMSYWGLRWMINF